MRDPDRANFAVVSGTVLAGFLIWGAHFLVIYAVAGLVCTRRLADSRVLGFGILDLTITAVTVIALVAAGTVLIRALRFAKQSDSPSVAFLGWMAAMIALLALVAIAWDGLPVLLVSGCG